VEEYIINYLFGECRKRGLAGVEGEYIKSPKNAMVQDFYKQFGFDLIKNDETRQVWYLEVSRYEPKRTFMSI
jgi:predicted enzyme involved in methoxymalonyl-ACP biosynthesis